MIIIKERHFWSGLNLKEIWEYRDLLVTLTWRDVRVKYKNTLLGVSWVVFQPLITLFIFNAFFGKIAKIESGDLRYMTFVYAGLIFWNFFSNSLSNISNILVENAHIVKKAYFPRIILPLAASFTALIDFLVNVIIFMLYLLLFDRGIGTFSLLMLSLGGVVTLLSGLGIGLIFTSLNVRFRDILYVLPFFIQLMLFLTPIIYSSKDMSLINRQILLFNPLTGLIENMRLSLVGTTINYYWLICSFVSTIVFLFLGIYVFNKTEKTLSDVL